MGGSRHKHGINRLPSGEVLQRFLVSRLTALVVMAVPQILALPSQRFNQCTLLRLCGLATRRPSRVRKTLGSILVFSPWNYYSIPFFSILFYSILFCSILFYSTLFYSTLFYSAIFYSSTLYSVLLYSLLLYSILV